MYVDSIMDDKVKLGIVWVDGQGGDREHSEGE